MRGLGKKNRNASGVEKEGEREEIRKKEGGREGGINGKRRR